MSDQQLPSNNVPPFDYKKWIYDMSREEARRAHDRINIFWEQINEATIKSADAALRTAVLINGGAAMSVLAFIGGLVSQNRIKIADLKDVSSSLMLFAFGVAAAVAGMALSYLVNYFTTVHASSQQRTWEHPYVVAGPLTKRYEKIKTTLHIFAVLVALASITLFVCGMFDVRESIVRIAARYP